MPDGQSFRKPIRDVNNFDSRERGGKGLARKRGEGGKQRTFIPLLKLFLIEMGLFLELS